MSATEKSPYDWLKPVFEYVPVVVFLAVYVLYRNEVVTVFGRELTGLLFATFVTIPVILFTTISTKLLFGKVPPMQMVMAVLVVGFGGLAILLNDERFIKMRPTLVYGLFAALLTFGVMTGRYYIKMMFGEQLEMPDDAWRKLTTRFIVFLAVMAVMNEVVWRMFSNDIWVALDKIGQPVLFIAFFLSQISLFVTYAGKPKA